MEYSRLKQIVEYAVDFPALNGEIFPRLLESWLMTEETRPEISTIARRVRLLRASAGLTQTEFAAQVLQDTSENSFKRVSRIENGQELSEEERRKIEDYFTISLDGSFIGDPGLESESGLDLQTDRQYFRHHRTYIEAAVKAWPLVRKHSELKGPGEVWFFGPTERLPVISDSNIQKRWIENLKLGIDKHLVWPLAVSSARDLKAFLDLAEHLLAKLPVANEGIKSGQIIFWACDPCAGSTNPLLAKAYADIRKRLSQLEVKGLVLHPVIELPDDPRFQRLLKLDTVILNRSAAASPYGADFLEDVCSEPNAGGRSGWLFLGRSTRSLLDEIADRLVKTLNEPPKHD